MKKEDKRIIEKMLNSSRTYLKTDNLLKSIKKNKILELISMLEVPVWGTALSYRIVTALKALEQDLYGFAAFNTIFALIDAGFAIHAINDIKKHSEVKDDLKKALKELIKEEKEYENSTNNFSK